MSFEERSVALNRICRALRPGGLFIFSTHNLHHRRVAAWMKKFFVAELAPAQLHMGWVHVLLMRGMNFWRQRERRELGFAYINDPAHRFSILTLYADIERQIGALAQLGFSALATIGNTKTTAGFDARDCWVYIVARRC